MREPLRILFVNKTGSFLEPFIEVARAMGLREFVAEGPLTEDFLDSMDVIFCNWADDLAASLSQVRWRAKLLVHVRSYEAYNGMAAQIRWEHVDFVSFAAPHIHDALSDVAAFAALPAKVHIPDGLDLDQWPLTQDRAREPYGWRVALVGRVGEPKNAPFAVELAHALVAEPDVPAPQVALRGPVCDPRLERYIDHHRLALGHALVREIPPADHPWFASPDMSAFYERFDYILSCSTHEGTHLALLEGMAKGCIPVVLDRPGAVVPREWTRSTVAGCLEWMRAARAHPRRRWRQWVEESPHTRTQQIAAIRSLFAAAVASIQGGPQ